MTTNGAPLARRDEAFWIHQYTRKRGFWISDENPARPHALLTSGLHSEGFFNSKKIIPDDRLLVMAASDLVDTLKSTEIRSVDRVVGPQTGATKLAEFIADEIARRRDRPCCFASPRNEGEGDTRIMVFDDPDRTVKPGEVVLLCEDVITTGGSIERAVNACHMNGGELLPYYLALVNRSGRQGVVGKRIVALIDRPMPGWTPDICPLCRMGSEAILPKNPANWKRLTAEL
jgi:orotate phosphoribosyltransferase